MNRWSLEDDDSDRDVDFDNHGRTQPTRNTRMGSGARRETNNARYPKSMASSREVYSDYDDDELEEEELTPGRVVGKGSDDKRVQNLNQTNKRETVPRSVSFPVQPTTAVVHGDVKLGQPAGRSPLFNHNSSSSGNGKKHLTERTSPASLRLDSDSDHDEDEVEAFDADDDETPSERDRARMQVGGGWERAAKQSSLPRNRTDPEVWFDSEEGSSARAGGDSRSGQSGGGGHGRGSRATSSDMRPMESDSSVERLPPKLRRPDIAPSIFDSIDTTASMPPVGYGYGQPRRTIPPSVFDSVDSSSSIAVPSSGSAPKQYQQPSRLLPSVFDSVDSLGTALKDPSRMDDEFDGEEDAPAKVIAVSPMRIEIGRRPSGSVPGFSSEAKGLAHNPLASSWETAVPFRKHTPEQELPPGLHAALEAASDSLDAPPPLPVPVASASRPRIESRGLPPSAPQDAAPSLAPAADPHLALSQATSVGGRPPRPRVDSQYSALSSSFSTALAGTATATAATALDGRYSTYSSDNEDNDNDNDNDNDDASVAPSTGEVDGQLVLQPLSEYALRTGVVIEGWLQKKSDRTRLWQRRYFVLSESATEFCVLRIFYKAVGSSWGTVPLKLKAAIPISAIQMATFNANKVKKGKQFKVVFSRNGRPASGGGGSGYVSAQSSDAGGSDNGGTGGGEKVMSLKAESVQLRLLWVALIEKALAIFRQD